MTNPAEELPAFLTPEEADELKKQYPNLVVSTKPSYALLDEAKEGAWRIASVGNTPVALVWTDWDGGAGVIQMDSEQSDSLYRHFVAAKRMNTVAGVAYSASQYVNGYTFSDEMTGPLSGALDSIPGTEEEVDE